MSKQDAGHTEKARTVASASMKTLDDGAHVRWHGDAVDVVLDQTFLDLAGSDIFGNAVNAWRATGASLPSISTAPGTGRHVGYDPTSGNENVVVFAPYGWAKANGALAVTVLTYDDASGAIVDADLLVNGGGRFFANFDHDESGGDQNMVPIENAALSGNGSTTAQSPRFDLQSVVTHELGHFLGLGDDEDDIKTTMYARTAPGEIHKRLLTAADADIITALYAESTPSDTKAQAGCGGGRIASADASATRSWIGFAGAVAGWMMLGFARRRNWRLGRAIGALFTLTGAIAFLAPPAISRAASNEIAVRGDARVQITKTEPRRVDGIIQTSLTYRVTACHVAQCPQNEQQVVVYGGKLDGKTQVVGPFAIPQPGAEVAVSLHDGRGLLRTLKPRFLP